MSLNKDRAPSGALSFFSVSVKHKTQRTMNQNKNQNNPEQETKKLAFLNIRGMLLSYSNKEEREKLLESIKEWEN